MAYLCIIAPDPVNFFLGMELFDKPNLLLMNNNVNWLELLCFRQWCFLWYRVI